MELRVLGPLEVVGSAGVVPVGGRKLRALLAHLALHVDESVSEDRLIEVLWGDTAPRTATKTLQAYISRLRRLLSPGAGRLTIETTPGGYRLRAAEDALDIARMEVLAAQARGAMERGDHAWAAVALSEALRTWGGTPLEEFAGEPWAASESARLGELRAALIEQRVDAELACGRHAALVPELEALTAEHPLRERLSGQRMLALYRSGQQAHALRVYQEARQRLAEELGIEPCRELRTLESQMLQQDPALDWTTAPAEADTRRSPPTNIELAGLLFTDLEQSTSHLRELGEQYGEALARHHDLIRAAVVAEDGLEVGSEGDSLAAVFPSPAAAVRAGITAQHALTAESWPDSPWRVRMAVHAGRVTSVGGGAVGIALHEAARIRDAGHGGQILVSERARDLALGLLPADVILVELGMHEVRDIRSSVRLWQVGATAFPPLRTAGRHTGLHARSTFIGREAELEALRSAIDAHPLVTIAGPGGSGKSRLALEVAARAHGFEGVRFVDLALISSADQVGAAVADAANAPSIDELRLSLSRERLLLVIDNCEHVLDAIAPLIAELLDSCPELTIMTTSRAPLELTSEHVWMAPAMRAEDGIQLFCERAASAGVREVDTELVASVCARLDGIPLAIELAAARLRSMSPADLATRLDNQLTLLTGGTRDVPRHRTMRAAMDWSYALLSAEEQTALRRAAMFASDFSLEGAELVLVSGTSLDVPTAVDGLVLHSLVQLDRDAGRYRMLESVRQYAAEKLEASGEAASVAQAHTRWIQRLAAQASRGIFSDQRSWIDRLDAELPNIGAAIARTLDGGHVADAAEIVSALGFFWSTARKGEAAMWLDRIVPHAPELTPRLRARTLLTAGMVHNDDIDDERPGEWLADAVDLFRETGSGHGLSNALFWHSRATFHRTLSTDVREGFAEAARVASEVGNELTYGWSQLWLGLLDRVEGDCDSARTMVLKVLEWAEAAGVQHVVGAAHGELFALALVQEDLENARAESDAAVRIFRSVGDRWQVAINLCQRAMVDAAVGGDQLASARAHVVEALDLAEMIRGRKDVGFALVSAAYVLLSHHDEQHAVTLARVADRVALLEDLLLRLRAFGGPTLTGRLISAVEDAPPGDDGLDALSAVALARRWLLELDVDATSTPAS